MGMIGEIFALVGLHVDQASFAQASADMMATGESVDKLASKFSLLQTGALAAPALAVAAVAAVGLSVATAMQDASLTLTTVYGNLDVAREKFAWLKTFAAETPFEFPELLTATIQMKNAGLEAEEYMTNIGNAASVFNRSVTAASNAVVQAMNGEWESLRSFGISSIEVSSKNVESLGLSAEEIGKRALLTTDKYGKQIVQTVEQTNKVAVASLINDLMGKYDGAMEARSKSITGLYSTLKDNVGMSLAGIVGFSSEMEVRSFSLMGVLQELMETAVAVTAPFANMSDGMMIAVSVMGAATIAISLTAAAMSLWGPAVDLLSIHVNILNASLGVSLVYFGLVVVAAGLVAYGLYELDKRTGVITNTWGFLCDLLVVVVEDFNLLWDSISGEGSYQLQALQEWLENIWIVITDLAEATHLDDLFSFAWDISPLKLAYDAAKALWDLLTEWGSGISTRADAIRTANGEIGTSSTDMATSHTTAAEDMGIADDNITISAQDTEKGVKEAHKGILGSLSDWVTGSDGTATALANNDNKIVEHAKTTATAYQKAIADMLTQKQSDLDLTNVGGVMGTDPSIREAISPTGKGLAVSTGNPMFGDGTIGFDKAKGQDVLTYYETVNGKVKEHQATLLELHRIGVDTFMAESGGIKTVTRSEFESIQALDEYILAQKEKGIIVIPLDEEIINSQEKVATSSKSITQAIEDTVAVEKELGNIDLSETASQNVSVGEGAKKSKYDTDTLIIAQDKVANISLAEAANQNRLPGAAAAQSSIQVNDLGSDTKELNNTSLSSFVTELMNPGISANASTGEVIVLNQTTGKLNGVSINGLTGELLNPGTSAKTSTKDVWDLSTNTKELNGISLAGIITNLLAPGTSARGSKTQVDWLDLAIVALNPISLSMIISTLLKPGNSADLSNVSVGVLAGSITGLNSIDLSGISGRLSSLWTQAENLGKRIKEVFNEWTETNSKTGSSSDQGGWSTGQTSKEGVTVVAAPKTTVNNNYKTNTVVNNGANLNNVSMKNTGA